MHFPDVRLSQLFAPRSIAVVGASADPAKAGHQMVRSLSGFPGPLYAVNRDGVAVLARPGCRRLADIPEPIDLAVLVLPPEASVQVLEECGACGIHAAVLCSGGFAEEGEAGATLQRRAVEIAERHRIYLLGPNTSGFANPPREVFASFVPAIGHVHPGTLAVVAQSGGMNHTLGFLGSNEGLGFSHLIGLGNSANVDFPDVLDYLAGDSGTTAVALHLEGVRDGSALTRAIRELSRRKPVVAYKVGRADVGAFARSHTGALLGDQRLAVAALRQAGAVVVDSSTQTIDALKAVSTRRLTGRPTGVAVVTGQAGPGIAIADALRAAGISVPALAGATQRRIAELLPPITFTGNPVDTGRPGESFVDVLRCVAADPGIGVVVVNQVLEPALDLAATVGQLARECEKPILLASGGPAGELEPLFAELSRAGVACYPAPERAAAGAIALVQDALAHRAAPHRAPAAATREAAAVAANLADLAKREGRRSLYEDEAKQLLAVLGFVAPAGARLATRQGALSMAATIGYPVAAKLLARELTHKSEAGGVRLDLRDDTALDSALGELDAAAARLGVAPAYLIERYLPGSAELILGARRDPSFGPTVVAGAGGTLAELLQDVSVRCAPISDGEARAMLGELRSARLLAGYRSSRPFDHSREVARLLAALSELIAICPEIADVEVNPLILRPDGVFAVDAVVTVA